VSLTSDKRKRLEFEYMEVSRSYGSIAHFRGELLALLPIASGAGLFLLLGPRASDAPLAAIGVFGCVVTLGLFIYELRNIEECHALLRQGGRIEEALQLPTGTRRFSGKPTHRLNGLLGAEGAGWIIYTAILCGWTYVAVADSPLEGSARWWLPSLFLLVVLAKFARSSQRKSSMVIARAVDGAFARGVEDRFTGQVWLRSTVMGRDGTRVRMVHFTPGSRTHWHRHPGGQFLYAVTGRGRVRARGERRHVLDTGDVVYAGPECWHFHGAGPDSPLIHLAVTGYGTTEWGGPVNDDEYAKGFQV
jgi:quercetin dioxygenase-like cupin family protein